MRRGRFKRCRIPGRTGRLGALPRSRPLRTTGGGPPSLPTLFPPPPAPGRRALAGQHPQTPQEIITWLEETVAGWNAAPTPFVWGGKRQERRRRARQRRLGGAAAILPDHQSFVA